MDTILSTRDKNVRKIMGFPCNMYTVHLHSVSQMPTTFCLLPFNGLIGVALSKKQINTKTKHDRQFAWGYN